MNLSFLNESDSIAVIFYIVSFGLVAWFMGWGVSFITSLFIKILKKGV